MRCEGGESANGGYKLNISLTLDAVQGHSKRHFPLVLFYLLIFLIILQHMENANTTGTEMKKNENAKGYPLHI